LDAKKIKNIKKRVGLSCAPGKTHWQCRKMMVIWDIGQGPAPSGRGLGKKIFWGAIGKIKGTLEGMPEGEFGLVQEKV